MPVTYIAEATNPFVYAEGWSNAPLQGYVPPSGIQEIPVSLNQTFYLEPGGVFVPQLGPNGMQIDAWKITFVNPGTPAIKKQMILSDSFDATMLECYNKFNTVTEGPTDVVTNGVFQVNVAGTKSLNRKSFFTNYKEMMVSMRGAFTVNETTFPWTNPVNPEPGNNTNGIQKGSLITFHTQDWFSLYCFALPVAIRGYLNTLPEL